MEYMEIHSKCVKKQRVTPYYSKQHEPKGEQANHQANQGPNMRRIRTKPNTNYQNFAPNPHRHGPGPTGDPLEQGWRGVALPGCSSTPSSTASSAPARGPCHYGPKVVACAIPQIFPLEPPMEHYIRSLPPPFNTTTHKRAQ
jgi:hypothetical protein